MSPIKVILSLPIILIKTAWRFILVTILTFPISGFFIVPSIVKNEISSLIPVIAVLAVITLILSILTWKKSYEDLQFDCKWRW